MKKFEQQYDLKGRPIISTIASIKAWDESGRKPEWDESGHCVVCGDNMGIVRTKFGAIKCICALEEEKNVYASEIETHSTRYKTNKDIAIKGWGTEESKESILKLQSEIERWSNWPDYWITISGKTGTGKTTVLTGLATEFYPWAFYITASDFDAKLSSIMDAKDGSQGTVQQFLNILKGFPILLYDDLGSEYVKYGLDWVRSNLRKVIDYRYLRASEFPTVVATNMSEQGIEDYDMRIGSRLLDNDTGVFIPMSSVLDYRRATDANSNL